MTAAAEFMTTVAAAVTAVVSTTMPPPEPQLGAAALSKALNIEACRDDIRKAAAAKLVGGRGVSIKQCLLNAGLDEDQANNRTMQMRVRRQMQKMTRELDPKTSVKAKAAMPQDVSFVLNADGRPVEDDDISCLTEPFGMYGIPVKEAVSISSSSSSLFTPPLSVMVPPMSITSPPLTRHNVHPLATPLSHLPVDIFPTPLTEFDEAIIYKQRQQQHLRQQLLHHQQPFIQLPLEETRFPPTPQTIQMVTEEMCNIFSAPATFATCP